MRLARREGPGPGGGEKQTHSGADAHQHRGLVDVERFDEEPDRDLSTDCWDPWIRSRWPIFDVEAEGASLDLVTETDRPALLAEVLAESDRLRFLTPVLHQQMISELKWPGRDRLDDGIDVRTLGLDAGELAKLQIASRVDVMAYLAAWAGGTALGDGTRARIEASSAVAVIAGGRRDTS